MDELFLEKLFDLFIVIVIESKIYAYVHNIMDQVKKTKKYHEFTTTFILLFFKKFGLLRRSLPVLLATPLHVPT